MQVREQMEGYKLYAVVPFLVRFIDDLTNIYVRYNRRRLKGRGGPADEAVALATLFDTLLKVRHPPMLPAPLQLQPALVVQLHQKEYKISALHVHHADGDHV